MSKQRMPGEDNAHELLNEIDIFRSDLDNSEVTPRASLLDKLQDLHEKLENVKVMKIE
jgi:hypothetical protein